MSEVCYFKLDFQNGKTLPSVAEDPILNSRKSPKNIFFHETSCSNDGIVTLTPRQSCAGEHNHSISLENYMFINSLFFS